MQLSEVGLMLATQFILAAIADVKFLFYMRDVGCVFCQFDV